MNPRPTPPTDAGSTSWFEVPAGGTAHHYGLLGIPLFEASPRAINRAADDRMSLVNNDDSGIPADRAMEIVQRIAQARACLLDAASKASYDAQLRKQLNLPNPIVNAAKSVTTSAKKSPSKSAGPAPLISVQALPTTSNAAAGQIASSPVIGNTDGPRIAKFQPAVSMAQPAATAVAPGVLSADSSLMKYLKQHWQTVAGVAGVILLLTTAAVLMIWRPEPPEETAEQPVKRRDTVARNDYTGSQYSGTDTSSSPGAGPSQTGTAPSGTATAPGTGNAPGTSGFTPSGPNPGTNPFETPTRDPRPGTGTASPGTSAPVAGGKTPSPAPRAGVTADSSGGESKSGTGKLPIPTEDAKGPSRKLMNEVYRGEIDKAQTPADKLRLASRFKAQAATFGNDPSGRYVLLEQARDLAIEAGDLTLAFAVIDDLAKWYEVNALALKAAALPQLATQARTPVAAIALVKAIMAQLDVAISLDDYDLASKMLEVADAAVKNTRDGKLARDVQQRAEYVQTMAERFRKVSQAKQLLMADPGDAGASRTVGLHLALVKGKWEEGLPLLAQCDEPGLRDIAAEDLRNPAEVPAQLALGHRWWARSEGASENERHGLQLRAGYWYGKVQANIDGLEKELVQRRLLDIESAASLATDAPPLAVAPLSAVDATALQRQWAKYVELPPSASNSIGMKMVVVPPGHYTRGSGDNEPGRNTDEGPQHAVRITAPFLVSAHEVTMGDFARFVEASKYRTEAEQRGGGGRPPGPVRPGGPPQPQQQPISWKNPGFKFGQNSPVVQVTWNDAQAFCNWLSKTENKKYRLPTEAEWEYLYRCGTQGAYYSGDEQSASAHGWVQGNAAGKAPQLVGKRRANAWGVYDLQGNVWEWCSDWYGTYLSEGQADPTGPKQGNARIARGGASDIPAQRGAVRGQFEPRTHQSNLGFRVVCEIAK